MVGELLYFFGIFSLCGQVSAIKFRNTSGGVRELPYSLETFLMYLSSSSVVRDVLTKAGKPQRMSALYQLSVSRLGPMSKTHFRESIIGGMMFRKELEKQRVVPLSASGKAEGQAFFELKLTSSKKVRTLLADKDQKLQTTLTKKAGSVKVANTSK